MGFKIATSCGSVHPPHMTNISKKVRHAYHQDQPRRTMELVFKSDTPPAATTRILKLALGMYVDRNTAIKSISRSCVSNLLESILSKPLLSTINCNKNHLAYGEMNGCSQSTQNMQESWKVWIMLPASQIRLALMNHVCLVGPTDPIDGDIKYRSKQSKEQFNES